MTARSLSLSATRSFASSLTPETRHLIILVLVAAAIMAPTLVWGIPSNNDLSNHFRFALPFYDALRSGHFYPGWLAEANHGFGDASFRFYPPALYYLLALTRTLAGNWYAATIITFSALSVMGAVGVYFWAREFGSSELAMWAGILYSVAPYHLNQFFQAVMLAEFAGAVVLPFAFAFTERVCRRRRKRDVAGLAAAFAVLILTHLPLAVIGSIALAVYALLRIDRKTRSATVLCLASSVALGLAASACYWTTMLMELKWIRADNLNPEPSVDYRKNFVLSSFSPDYLNVWWMNILLLGTVAMFWPALALLSRRVYASCHALNSAGKPIKALAVVLLLTIFMATPASRPLWRLIHPLQETQFPWRWLSITSMVCPILLALTIPFWARVANGKKRPLAMIALGTVAISLAFSAGHIVREARWLTPAQFEQTLSSIPGSPGVYTWLPVWAHDPLPNMTAAVEAGDRQLTIKSWQPERRILDVSAGATTEARVRTFFYPHWKASAAGRPLDVHPDQNGALVIALPKEAAEIELEFREPIRVKYAAGLTLIGWVLIGGLLLKRRTRNSLPVSD
jgi:6-pyruvoyl-tetrahydropterin synthase related domain